MGGEIEGRGLQHNQRHVRAPRRGDTDDRDQRECEADGETRGDQDEYGTEPDKTDLKLRQGVLPLLERGSMSRCHEVPTGSSCSLSLASAVLVSRMIR